MITLLYRQLQLHCMWMSRHLWVSACVVRHDYVYVSSFTCMSIWMWTCVHVHMNSRSRRYQVLYTEYTVPAVYLYTHTLVVDPLPQRIFELFGQQNPKLDFQNSRLYLGRTLTLCFVKIKILPKQWLIVQCMYAMYTSC